MAKRKRKRTVIIDGDIPLYSVAFSVETPVDWGDDFWTLHADMGEARDSMMIWVDKVVEATKATDVLMALSSSPNWRREDLASSYKANRDGKRKPVLFKPLSDFIRQRWECVEFPRLEADDVLGLLATKANVIASADKDLLSVPCNYFNPNAPEDGVTKISYEQAYLAHMIQTLMGDSTDNYKGCPGVGPVVARRLLADKDPEEYWDIVVAQFEKAGQTYDDALLQARLAHILWPGEYDKTTQEIKLWCPPA
jgi:DNA polymerase-1